MNDSHFRQPQTYFTRLNDILEEDKNEIKEDFSPSNYIRTNFVGKLREQEKKKVKNQKKNSQLKNQDDNAIKKYVNKELIESWINAINTRKFIILLYINNE